MKKLVVVLSIFIFLYSSCKKNAGQAVVDAHLINDSILVASGEKTLSLGEYDYPICGLIRYYEKNGEKFLAQCNNRTKSVSVYDYEMGNLVKTISLSGIFPLQGELYFHNEDSMLLRKKVPPVGIFSSLNKEVKKVDVSITTPYNLGMGDGIVRGAPNFRTGIFPFRSKWYMTTLIMGEAPDEMKKGEDRPPVFEVDFSNGSYRYLSGYPQLYVDNNMGSVSGYWTPHCVLNSSTEELIVSFRASPEINVISLNDFSERKVSVKSSYIDTIPLPLTAKGRDYFDSAESYYNFAQYGHYGDIVYDPWNKVYYRFIGIGLNDFTLKKDTKLMDSKKCAIMVFNENFELLGEVPIGNTYNIRFFFVTADGLFVLKMDKNEDVAVYKQFKLNY